MNHNLIRKKFFDFFKINNHVQVASSSLIPAQDPTLLFTNAGMNQFKDLFLGLDSSYKRATSIQKCMRAGGKHNDLDNVGFTARHLTFFEMMGNFSFGDYFKKEAIQFAWDFLTKTLQIAEEKLYATVYLEDDESYDIWHNHIGLPKERISRLGAKDNFWQMGDVGPCGPCSEIYIDRGIEYGSKNDKPGDDSERFLEIWNLVFMQFDRQKDGHDLKLKKPGVDTGMGLERLLMVLENKNSVYETSIFQEIIKNIEKLTGKSYLEENLRPAFNVLADHIRSSTFLLADGCAPSNDGRGYVLRKIIRRAALFEQKLTEKSIFADLAKSVIKAMAEVYPELTENESYIISVLKSEIEKFASNLIRGRNLIAKMFSEQKNKNEITSEEAFKLYDTFGFPIELIQLVAKEHHALVNLDNFNKEMEKQKLQSGKKLQIKDQINLPENLSTKFTGYNEVETDSNIIAIIYNNELVKDLKPGQEGTIIAKECPFFVECGGQINDQGYLEFETKKTSVKDLIKINNCIGLKIIAETDLKLNDKIKLVVDNKLRQAIMKNHTATHLLQAALKNLFGNQLKQSGSIVTPEYLRFDFTYHENLTAAQIKNLEEKVNEKIMENISLNIYETDLNNAIKKGITAIFGEKYNPECVRVIDIPSFSAELCGGTHVKRTGDIGIFKITESTALSAGNRRIVAVTGLAALELFQREFNTVKQISQNFKVQQEHVLEAIEKQTLDYKKINNELNNSKKEMLYLQIPLICSKKQLIQNIAFVNHEFKYIDNSLLQEVAQIIAKNINCIAFVYTNINQKSSFVIFAQPDLKINLESLKIVLQNHGIKCGSKNNSLQGGGSIIDNNLINNIVKVLN